MDENRPHKEDFVKIVFFFSLLAGGRQGVKYYFELKAAFVHNKFTRYHTSRFAGRRNVFSRYLRVL